MENCRSAITRSGKISLVVDPTNGPRIRERASAPARHEAPGEIARAVAVGILAGGLAVLFRWAIDGVDQVRLAILVAAHAHPGWGWMALPLFGARGRMRDRLADRPLRAGCAGQRDPAHRGRAARAARHAVEGAPAREVRRWRPRHWRRLLARARRPHRSDGRLRGPGRGRGHWPARWARAAAARGQRSGRGAGRGVQCAARGLHLHARGAAAAAVGLDL